MTRVFNFSAGPAVLPQAVLQQAASEMLDWHGSGMSVMEMSHRGKEFISIAAQAEADLRELLAVPANYKILFMQGGGLAANAIVPLNLLQGKNKIDFVHTGSWSGKSIKEAQRYATANVVASSAASGFTNIPPVAEWQLSNDAAYLHYCGNETIGGVEFHEVPDLAARGYQAPLVVDASSHILSRPLDVSRFGVVFAGAQKNIGPAGLTIVIVRDDLIGKAEPHCPSAFDYKLVADNDSMYNTPPTYAIYIAGLVFKWLKAEGGVLAMEQRNVAKAKLFYDFLAQSSFFENRVDPACRSRMNIPFFLKDESRNDAFLAQARDAGLIQIKGHKSVGGMRASLYNAMPLEGVQTLIEFMREFERRA